MYDLNAGTLEEFLDFHSDLGIEDYRDFEEHRRDEQFSVEESPLGALLALLNYYSGDESNINEHLGEEFQRLSGDVWDYLREYSEADFPDVEAILRKDLGIEKVVKTGAVQLPLFGQVQQTSNNENVVLALRYGFVLSDPALLIQGMSAEELEQFITKWYTAQSGEKRWNPSYAPSAELRPEVQEFCKTHTVPEILREFNLFRRKNSPYGLPLLTETLFHIIQSDDSENGLLYAMNGWSLAECVRLSYENGKNK